MLTHLPRLSATLFILSCAAEAPKSPPADDRFDALVEGSLFSDHDEKQLRKNRALAVELERTLSALAGVNAARVHLSLRDPSILSRDRDAAGRAAILIVKEAEAAVTEEAIRRFAAAAVPDLAPERVSVLVQSAPPVKTRITDVGPFAVDTRSAAALKLTLSLLLGITIVLSLGLIAAGYRIRKLKQPLE